MIENDVIKMMEEVEIETNKMKEDLDISLTLILKYRKYIEIFHPEIHNKAIEYINKEND